MTLDKATQRRLGTIALALVCVLVLAKIIIGFWGGSGTPAAAAPPSRFTGVHVPPGVAAPPPNSANDAVLQLDLLKEFDARPLPDFQRNPFEFGPTPEQIRATKEAENLVAHPTPPPPPPPPPVPFKAMGYQQDAKGARLDTYIVHEGQEFGQRFKVLKITDASVEVQDETYHQIVELPYPAE
jgi:hypothetical protein